MEHCSKWRVAYRKRFQANPGEAHWVAAKKEVQFPGKAQSKPSIETSTMQAEFIGCYESTRKGLFLPAVVNGWAAVKSRWMKLSPVPEFKDQIPKMLRNDSEALGNTLVTFTNKNNNSL
ncbi:unnamed protein product [Prunus armeniaca]